MKPCLTTTWLKGAAVVLALPLAACSRAPDAQENGGDSKVQSSMSDSQGNGGGSKSQSTLSDGQGSGGGSNLKSSGSDNSDPGVSVPVPMGLLSGDKLAEADAATLGAPPASGVSSGIGQGADQGVSDASTVANLNSEVPLLAWRFAHLKSLMDDLFSTSGFFHGATIDVTPGTPELFSVTGTAAQDASKPRGVRVSVVAGARYPLLVEVFCAPQNGGDLVGCLRIQFKPLGTESSAALVHLTFFDALSTGQSYDGMDITYTTGGTTQQGILDFHTATSQATAQMAFTITDDASTDRDMLTFLIGPGSAKHASEYSAYSSRMSVSQQQGAFVQGTLNWGVGSAADVRGCGSPCVQYFSEVNGQQDVLPIAPMQIDGLAQQSAAVQQEAIARNPAELGTPPITSLEMQIGTELLADKTPLASPALVQATMPAMTTAAAGPFQGAPGAP